MVHESPRGTDKIKILPKFCEVLCAMSSVGYYRMRRFLNGPRESCEFQKGHGRSYMIQEALIRFKGWPWYCPKVCP